MGHHAGSGLQQALYSYQCEPQLIRRPPAGAIPVQGVFKNFNTIEQFKSTEEKKALFDQVADSIYASFDQDEPDLHKFLLVTFADLKKYVYQYWFAFPALVSKPGWELEEALSEVTQEVSYVLYVRRVRSESS